MGLIEKPRHPRKQLVAALPDDIGQKIMDGVVSSAPDDPFRLPDPEKVNGRDKDDEPEKIGDLHRTQYQGIGGKAGERLVEVISC